MEDLELESMEEEEDDGERFLSVDLNGVRQLDVELEEGESVAEVIRSVCKKAGVKTATLFVTLSNGEEINSSTSIKVIDDLEHVRHVRIEAPTVKGAF